MHPTVKSDSFLSDCFAVTFHVKLLDVSRESKKSLAVRKDSTRLNSTDVSVVKSDQAEVRRNALFFRFCLEVYIHFMHSSKE
jgi:hypothetical protein